MHTGFWWGNIRDGDHLEDLGVNGRILLKLILKKKKDSGVNWINVAEDWDKCQAVVNTVKIHRFT